jgi:hypothetical protein
MVNQTPNSKNDRKYNGQKKKNKTTTNGRQNSKHNAQVYATGTSLKTGKRMCSGRVISFCSTCNIRRVPLLKDQMISQE